MLARQHVMSRQSGGLKKQLPQKAYTLIRGLLSTGRSREGATARDSFTSVPNRCRPPGRVGRPGRSQSHRQGVLTPSEPPGAPLISSAPTKPIRYWFEMGDQDLFYPNPTIPDGMHDWTLSAELMAKVLAEKGFHYQFLFAQRQACRLPDGWANPAGGAGMVVEGLSKSVTRATALRDQASAKFVTLKTIPPYRKSLATGSTVRGSICQK